MIFEKCKWSIPLYFTVMKDGENPWAKKYSGCSLYHISRQIQGTTAAWLQMKGSCPLGPQDKKHEKSRSFSEHSLIHHFSPTTLEIGILYNINLRLEYSIKKEYSTNQSKARTLYNIKVKKCGQRSLIACFMIQNMNSGQLWNKCLCFSKIHMLKP